MRNKRRIEVFTAGCPLCTETLDLVKKAVAGCGCEVVEQRCTENECCDAAKRYGVRAMPSVVVGGNIVFEGRLTQTQAELLRR